MTAASAFDYPAQKLTVRAFTGSLEALFPRPRGNAHPWPPIQITYLGSYLTGLECETVVHEAHYLDRDYIEDLALFYSRSLRDYPNHCARLHFFSRPISPQEWEHWIARGRKDYEATCRELSESYLGFSVIRPIPGRPIGRTVLRSFGAQAEGAKREFRPLRAYTAHVNGLRLSVQGLAFQQQDEGVSACATTALWTALHGTANREGLKVPTPAEITSAASRYLLLNGRALPSEGLAVQQVCEAIRDTGLAPVVVPASYMYVDRGVMDTYLRSGFPVVLAVKKKSVSQGEAGHAICAVGAKIGEVDPQPDLKFSYRDGSTALKAVYVHDDRLGPYAVAQLEPCTVVGPTPGTTLVQTSLRIRWPGTYVEEESWRLHAIVVPVPNKVRLSVIRVRAMGRVIGESLGAALPDLARSITVHTRYVPSVVYQRELFPSDLSDAGLERIATGIALSRYIAVIEVTTTDGPLVDVALDCTEAVENPSVIAVVDRSQLPVGAVKVLRDLASQFGSPFVK